MQSGSLRTVLELVLILSDEGDADALVSRLLQNHKPEERHRLLLAEGHAGDVLSVDGPPRRVLIWASLGEGGKLRAMGLIPPSTSTSPSPRPPAPSTGRLTWLPGTYLLVGPMPILPLVLGGVDHLEQLRLS